LITLTNDGDWRFHPAAEVPEEVQDQRYDGDFVQEVKNCLMQFKLLVERHHRTSSSTQVRRTEPIDDNQLIKAFQERLNGVTSRFAPLIVESVRRYQVAHHGEEESPERLRIWRS
jgi:hypothetical protein